MKVKYKTAYEFCGSNFVMVIYDEIVESNFRYPDLCETRTGYLTVLEHLPTIKFALIRTTYGFCLTEIKSGCSLIGIQSKSKIFTKVQGDALRKNLVKMIQDNKPEDLCHANLLRVISERTDK